MSEALTLRVSDSLPIPGSLGLCGCKAVIVRFSCGHDFARIQYCNETMGIMNGTEHYRRKVVLQVRTDCAECVLMTSSNPDQLAVEVAVGELSQHGSPPNIKVLDELREGDKESPGSVTGHDQGIDDQVFDGEIEWSPDSAEDTLDTVIHHESVNVSSCAYTYQLPAVTYNPFAPGRISIPNDQDSDQTSAQQHQVTKWIGETNDFFNIEPSTSDSLFDWLRSEILQSPDDTQLQFESSGLIHPVLPLQYLDDPYDTSASSCARASDGIIQRYKPDLDELPAIESWLDGVSPLTSPRADHFHRLTRTQSLSWPIVPVIHITKQGPPPSIFSKTRVHKQSLTKRVKSSISKTYRVISEKFFTKRGIDGRILQRRHSIAISLQSASLFSRRRNSTRAEKKADDLRRKMLRRKYDESGYFEVVSGDVDWDVYGGGSAGG